MDVVAIAGLDNGIWVRGEWNHREAVAVAYLNHGTIWAVKEESINDHTPFLDSSPHVLYLHLLELLLYPSHALALISPISNYQCHNKSKILISIVDAMPILVINVFFFFFFTAMRRKREQADIFEVTRKEMWLSLGLMTRPTPGASQFINPSDWMRWIPIP